MNRICTIGGRILLCSMLCLPLAGASQEVHTKSGTLVKAVPHVRAVPTEGKSAVTDPTAGTYLVLSPPEWHEALEPLMRWKREQGFRVEWMAAEVRQRDTLRSRLTARYQASSTLLPPQRYVLLVGDVDRIQSFVGRHTPAGLNNTATDLYYGEYTGDYLPEALVGRLSVADSQELARVVEKLVAYEQGRLFPADSHLLLVAGHEDRAPAPTTTNGQVDYLRRLAQDRTPALLPATHPNNDSATTSALIALLHRPYALVSYTGHGLRNGWSNPVLTATMADTLAGFVPAVMVNNCCLTNAFDGTCFGEQMLRSPGGPVGMIGATNETLWDEDYYWAVGAKYPPMTTPPDTGVPGAFDTLLASPAPPHNAASLSLGRILFNGCLAVTLSGSAFDAFYWETYCLLGDPSMVPALGAQDSLWIDIDTLVTAGDGHLMAATVPYARVNVTTDSTLLGTAVADSLGWVTVALDYALTGDSVRVTVVRPQGKPCGRTIMPVSPADGRLAVTGYSTDEDGLHVQVANVGRQSASEVRLVLSVEGVDDTLRLPDIAAGTRADTLFPLRGEWHGRSVEGLLTACANTECTALPVAFDVAADCPQITSLKILTHDSLPAAYLLPNHEYLLKVVLTHMADSIAVTINGQRSVANGRQPQADGQWAATFPLSIDTDFRAEVQIEFFPACGQTAEHFWLYGFRAVETFESGTFDAYPWQLSQAYPWQVDTLAPQGRFAVRSAPLPDGMKSTLAISVEVLKADSVSFLYNVSSEASDWLYFYIDGRKQGYWSGATGWQRYAYPLSAGHHLLEWHYVKDGSISQRDDCARLDNIAFPLCRWAVPCGNLAVDSILLAAVPPYSPFPSFNSRFSAYPNPVVDCLVVETAGPLEMTLLNTVGQCIGHFPVNGKACYSTQHLPAGVYWLAAQGPDTPLSLQKLIIVK